MVLGDFPLFVLGLVVAFLADGHAKMVASARCRMIAAGKQVASSTLAASTWFRWLRVVFSSACLWHALVYLRGCVRDAFVPGWSTDQLGNGRFSREPWPRQEQLEARGGATTAQLAMCDVRNSACVG